MTPATTRTTNPGLRAAALLSGLAVALGAFGAHGLESFLADRFPDDPQAQREALEWWETGARYQMFHGLGLLALCAARRATRGIVLAFWIGAILFSGSLYGLTLGGPPPVLGPITPLGGSIWIGAWLVLAFKPAATERP